MSLPLYCDACQAMPRQGFCNLAGCPRRTAAPQRPSLKGTAIEHDAERLRIAEQKRARKAARLAKGMAS